VEVAVEVAVEVEAEAVLAWGSVLGKDQTGLLATPVWIQNPKST